MVAAKMPDHFFVDDVRHIKCADDVSDSLMDSFDDCIGLRVPNRFRFLIKDIVVLTHFGKFSHKFGTAIKHNSLWKWVTSEPIFLGDICNFCSRLIRYLCHLEPACGRINHCKAPQFKRGFPF